MTTRLIENLNNDQKEAVLNFDSPLLIIAGAGSGKTRVITNKIAYMIEENGFAPRSILGVTFTNKAAGEMRERIEKLTGIDRGLFNIYTFHSLGLRLLRENAKHCGFEGEWQIIDDGDQKKILERIMKSNLSNYTTDMRDLVKRKISKAKVNLDYPNSHENLIENGFTNEEVRIYTLYFQHQRENRVWDYEDLISLPVLMLQNYPELLEKVRSRFRYVLVDEFQDTNPNQYELIRLLAKEHRGITVVGDDDQAIYSWRGASIRFLHQFEQDFNGAKLIKLQQNYRSTKPVLDFANNMILRNTARKEKAMWTENETGNPVVYLDTNSKEDEAKKAADIVKLIAKEKPELLPVAVLYRINAQSLAFETEFANRKIKFRILKGLRFFDRKEVKDSISLLRLAVNPDDDLAFLRVLDFLPLGIGAKTIEKIEQAASEFNLSLFRATARKMPEKISQKPIFRKIAALHDQIEDLKYSDVLMELVRHSGYMETLETRNEESRILNISELENYIKSWEETTDSRNFAELVDTICLDSGEADQESADEAFLLTMHNAKGMEFNTVIAAGINQSYMPFFLRKGSAELEEERRLFYVASTRAEKQLIVSSGSKAKSKFMSEIRPSLYRYIHSADELMAFIDPDYEKPSAQTILKAATQGKEDLRKVKHPFFGEGEVVNQIDAKKYLVKFATKGEKVIDTSIVKLAFL